MKWTDDGRLSITPPKRPKKITGTRFGAILGYNKWNSPFTTWCEITRTWEKPFEDTKYTLAGKAIEPKQADYIEKKYHLDILRPSDKYGKDYFKTTRGDFFPNDKVFGGMWDYLLIDEGKISAVLEMKTTKRAEDWETDIPEYYALQAALYAYLLGTDNVFMVCSLLKEEDYEAPEEYEVTPQNTFIKAFKVSERYPDFESLIEKARAWWEDHVEFGISPKYDEKKDAEALAALRKNNVNPDTDLDTLIKEANVLNAEIAKVTEAIAEKEKRLKVLKDMIKTVLQEKFRDGDNKVEVTSGNSTWILAKSTTSTLDKDALKADGLLEKYTVDNTTYRLTVKEAQNGNS